MKITCNLTPQRRPLLTWFISFQAYFSVCVPNFNKIKILLYVQFCNLTGMMWLFPCISPYSSVELISLPNLGSWGGSSREWMPCLAMASGLSWVGIREGCCLNQWLWHECAVGGQEPSWVECLLIYVCSLFSDLSEDTDWCWRSSLLFLADSFLDKCRLSSQAANFLYTLTDLCLSAYEWRAIPVVTKPGIICWKYYYIVIGWSWHPCWKLIDCTYVS